MLCSLCLLPLNYFFENIGALIVHAQYLSLTALLSQTVLIKISSVAMELVPLLPPNATLSPTVHLLLLICVLILRAEVLLMTAHPPLNALF